MKSLVWGILAFGLQNYAFSNSQLTHSTEKVVIESFYKKYLKDYAENRYKNPSNPPFSKSLNALMQKDKKVCAEYEGDDVCGWNVDGDVYLDTQEANANLTFENANLTFSNPQIGIVNVTLNTEPFPKIIQYKLVQENHQWVIDDIVYLRGNFRESTRQKIRDEIARY